MAAARNVDEKKNKKERNLSGNEGKIQEKRKKEKNSL